MAKSPTPLTPGVSFKDGKLCIFSSDSVIVIRGWPDLQAVRKGTTCCRCWTKFRPEFRLLKPYRGAERSGKRRPGAEDSLPLFDAAGISVPRRRTPAEQREAAFAGFRFTLPKEVAHSVERFSCHQWHPLLLLQRKTGGPVDLFNSNSGLAFCLAHNHKLINLTASTPAIQACWVIRKRQRDIAGWLQFPATEAVVNILRKIAPESMHAGLLKPLRTALGNADTVKVLGHLPAIHAGVLGFVTDPNLQAHVAPAFLQEVAADRSQTYRSRLPDLLRDILDMLPIVQPERHLGPLQSVPRLQEIHDELGAAYCRIAGQHVQGCAFPRPPIPGTPQIIPLRSPGALVEEGEIQRNCVASYAKRVEAGTTYIYRVTHPERATLSLVLQPGGTWERGELRAARNAAAKAETTAFVDQWLGQYTMML